MQDESRVTLGMKTTDGRSEHFLIAGLSKVSFAARD